MCISLKLIMNEEINKEKSFRNNYYMLKIFDCCNKCSLNCFTKRRINSDKNLKKINMSKK